MIRGCFQKYMNIRTWDREIAGLALCGGCDILRRSAAFCQGGQLGLDRASPFPSWVWVLE